MSVQLRLLASGVAVLLVTLGVVAAPEPAPSPRPVAYFPTRVGDAWVYLHTDRRRKTWKVAEEVTSTDVRDGARVVTVGRTHTDAQVYPNRVREVSDRGVVQTTDLEFGDLAAPWVHLRLPHEPGQSWEHEGTTYTAHGPERVKVPAGEFQAIRVEQRKRGEPGSEPLRTEWYAAGRGIVKLTTPGVTIEMKSFTPGK